MQFDWSNLQKAGAPVLPKFYMAKAYLSRIDNIVDSKCLDLCNGLKTITLFFTFDI